MRKYVYMAIVLAICIWGINTVTIKASDLNKNEEYMSIDDFEINDSIKTLEKNGYRDLNFRHILDEIMSGNVLDVIKECSNVVYQKTVGDFTMVEKALGNLLLIVILSAFFTSFRSRPEFPPIALSPILGCGWCRCFRATTSPHVLLGGKALRSWRRAAVWFCIFSVLSS